MKQFCFKVAPIMSVMEQLLAKVEKCSKQCAAATGHAQSPNVDRDGDILLRNGFLHPIFPPIHVKVVIFKVVNVLLHWSVACIVLTVIQCWERSLVKWVEIKIKITQRKSDLKSKSKSPVLKWFKIRIKDHSCQKIKIKIKITSLVL